MHFEHCTIVSHANKAHMQTHLHPGGKTAATRAGSGQPPGAPTVWPKRDCGTPASPSQIKPRVSVTPASLACAAGHPTHQTTLHPRHHQPDRTRAQPTVPEDEEGNEGWVRNVRTASDPDPCRGMGFPQLWLGHEPSRCSSRQQCMASAHTNRSETAVRLVRLAHVTVPTPGARYEAPISTTSAPIAWVPC